jgi:hypothetical protein
MKQAMLLLGLITLVVAMAGAQSVVVSSAQRDGKAMETRFIVRVENTSSADGLAASDGTRWPFAVSPGTWVVHEQDGHLFTVGRKADANGLEAQAEDGNPEMLVNSLGSRAHGSHMLHGFFNVPVGATGPGPITPGGAYEFTFSAKPGMKLSFAMMFGQSNDLFYAPEKAIALFDEKGRPTSGDITSRVLLFDAGTEVNQEPGIGPDQAPRQKAPNTGQSESKVVGPVKDDFTYPKTENVLRITITPQR